MEFKIMTIDVHLAIHIIGAIYRGIHLYIYSTRSDYISIYEGGQWGNE